MLYIIVYKMKQQITENEENLILGKIAQALKGTATLTITMFFYERS